MLKLLNLFTWTCIVRQVIKRLQAGLAVGSCNQPVELDMHGIELRAQVSDFLSNGHVLLLRLRRAQIVAISWVLDFSRH